jgi:hypothetical protein
MSDKDELKRITNKLNDTIITVGLVALWFFGYLTGKFFPSSEFTIIATAFSMMIVSIVLPSCLNKKGVDSK